MMGKGATTVDLAAADGRAREAACVEHKSKKGSCSRDGFRKSEACNKKGRKL